MASCSSCCDVHRDFLLQLLGEYNGNDAISGSYLITAADSVRVSPSISTLVLGHLAQFGRGVRLKP